MLVHPVNKLIHFRKNTPDGIAAIYINTALRTFALSLVGIFLPVFLFLKSQEIFGHGMHLGFYGIIFFFLIQRVVMTLFLLPASRIISIIGYRWSVFWANILLVILLALLSVSGKYFWIIPLAAIVNGFQVPLYWLSYRSLFAREGVMPNIGHEVGMSAITTKLASIAGPALGGLIIVTWGFSALFTIALLVVVLSGIPFFFMPKHDHKLTVSFESISGWLKSKKHRNEEISFLGKQMEDFIYGIFWPVYVYLLLGSFEKQGLVFSLSLITGTVMVYIAGKVFDKKHSRNIFNVGVYVNSFMWVLRGLVKNIGQLLFVEASANALSPFYWITFDSLMYERSREKGEKVIVFMVGRTIIVSLATLIVLVVAYVFAAHEMRFRILWILAIIGSLLTLFMWEKKGD